MKLLFASMIFALVLGSCSDQPATQGSAVADTTGAVVVGETPSIRVDSIDKPASSTIFDTAHGKGLLKQCSRPAPVTDSFWVASRSDIDQLESRLSGIRKLGTDSFAPDSVNTRQVSDFAIQYLGVVIGGKRMIYLNAFGAKSLEHFDLKQYPLDSTPMIVCDGGAGFWGALYDPATGEFSQFEPNGALGGKGGKRGGK